MARKKAWQRAQTRACDTLRMKEVGGPGRPDCVGTRGAWSEVKHLNRRLRAGDIHTIAESATRWGVDVTRGTICAERGWDDSAGEVAASYGLRLRTCAPHQRPSRVRNPSFGDVLARGVVGSVSAVLIGKLFGVADAEKLAPIGAAVGALTALP